MTSKNISLSPNIKAGLKLKDSCDICATSKVKCDKQKPICSRCNRLGSQCTYSPARRIGRPYPRRGVPALKSSSTKVAKTPPHHHHHQQQQQHLCLYQNKLITESEISTLRSTTTISGPVSYQISETSESSPTRKQRSFRFPETRDTEISSNDGHQEECTSTFSENSLIEQASLAHKIDRAHSNLISSCENHETYGICQTENRTTRDHKVEENILKVPTNNTVHDMHQNPFFSDCATVALNILLQLDLEYEKIQMDASVKCVGMDSQNYDTTIETLSINLRQLSIILICPCSETLEVGLLAASICLVILDILYYTTEKLTTSSYNIHGNSKQQQQQPSLGTKDFMTGVYTEFFYIANARDDVIGNSFLLKLMVELPRVAKVILQFTSRYSSFETLAALATHVKSRFQSFSQICFS